MGADHIPVSVNKPSQWKGKDPDKWGFFTNLTFAWQNRIVPLARKGKITVDELPLPSDKLAEQCYAQFNANWEAALAANKDSSKSPSLLKVLFKTYGKRLMLAGIFKLLWSVFVILGAYYFTRSILECIRTLEGLQTSVYDEEWKGWVLAICFFIDAWLLGICLQRMGFGVLNIGIKVRAALITAITRKCYSMATLTKEVNAQAVAFVANDINKIFEGIQEIHYLWTAPFEAGAIVVLLSTLVGIYCLPALAIVCLVVPAQYYFGFKIIRNKMLNAPNVNERYSIVQELLPAMKLVKYYAWEQFFEKEVNEVRRRELRYMIRNAAIKTINVSMVFGVPPSVAMSVLIPYELTQTGRFGATGAAAKWPGMEGPYVTTVTSFVLLSLFNILRFPLVVLPKALRCASESIASARKIETFMARRVVNKQNTTGTPGVHIKNAVFTHHTNENFKLRIPEFSVKPGELVAVVGRVGAGKTSLFEAILGNMVQVEGEAAVGGQVAYVPQNPWCQNLTIKESILFGKPLEERKYANVIHACALELDLEILQAGDQSMVGLRGINLSGGQRQRLNLARCAYFDGDLVLLDNALSAVDHHTAQHIFEHCVKGIFADKATILITHQVEFLSRCDRVAIMNEGDCLYFGKWNQEAAQILSRYLPASHMLAAAGAAEQPRDPKPKKAATQKEVKSEASKAPPMQDRLTLSRAIWEFLNEARWIIFCCSLLIFLSCQTSRQMGDYFIRFWTRDWYGKWNPANRYGPQPNAQALWGEKFYIMVYGLCGFYFIFSMLFRGTFLYWWALGASCRFQKKSLHRVLYAPLGYFLRTPVGDLLVSFTKDQDVMDESLPDALYYAGIYGLILVATTITVSTIIPLFSALTGGLFVVSFIMLALYMPAATHLKKLRMDTSGAVVTLVAEALDGLQTIQAFNQQQYFVQWTSQRVNDNHKALFAAETLNLWLAFFCDFYGACLILAVACFAMGQWQTLGSGNVGLAFSQTIQMLVFYTWSVRLLADSIGLFGSTEKLAFLGNHIPQEGGKLQPPHLYPEGGKYKIPYGKKGDRILRLPVPMVDNKQITSSWPSRGQITFEGVVMKYAPHLPPALKGVTFSVQPQEKVGVVGRTGSGKSTLLLALYRMFNLESGRIVVDGIDISTLSLPQLRRGLSVIPQEPVVFSGTVRSNMDPFGEYGTDADLWDVLNQVGLADHVTNIGGLDAKVDSVAQSWSLGQAQLMCLARAALKKVPVLCLDEATAAMDPATEQLVLDTIRRMFADRTTFTIAHRLDTVIESDQVIVMESGELAEMAPSHVLLSRPDSMFSKLVDKTGPAGAAALRKMAREYYEKTKSTTAAERAAMPPTSGDVLP